MRPLLLGAVLMATPFDAALAATDAAPLAIFAYRDRHGRPTAWPMTPYRDGERVVVTSTLAFMRKTESVRRDGRVALLAGGWLLQGDAAVHADPSGNEFVQRFLAAEQSKYPPVADILSIPLHRWLFDWYFGRVFMEITPRSAAARPGDDHATLITLDAEGVPVITPLAVVSLDGDVIQLREGNGASRECIVDGPATILLHAEDAAMRDLRQRHLYGRVEHGVFHVRRRSGSLTPAARRGWWAQLREQWDLRQRGRDGRARVEAWREER